MISIPARISLPQLWQSRVFERQEWSPINVFVGPNGTGKSLFADKLRRICQDIGLQTRHLTAERLAGLQRENYNWVQNTQIRDGFNIGQSQQYKDISRQYGLASDAYMILKEKLDVRIRVEATLSTLFGRQLRLAEEGGFLIPRIQPISGTSEYGVRESECDGLKELIPILTYLYDGEQNCLILDEPELHLHPQYQSWLMQEIRRLSGNPFNDAGKKIFFIVTHSPYFVDIQTLEDLRSLLVFKQGDIPVSYVGDSSDDVYRISKLIPRLNVHNKQLFFASAPIFVEGYLDQNIMSTVCNRRNQLLGASGSSLIDVGGKDQLDAFFRITRSLRIDSRFIMDLDGIFGGNLRQSLSGTHECRQIVQQQGLGSDLNAVIGQLEQALDALGGKLEREARRIGLGAAATSAFEAITNIPATVTGRDLIRVKRLICAQMLALLENERESIEALGEEFNIANGRLNSVIDTMSKCNVFILRRGELENYLPSYTGNHFQVSDNAKLQSFASEMSYLQDPMNTETDVASRYAELIKVLDLAIPSRLIDLDRHLCFAIGDWIHLVQSAFGRGQLLEESQLFQIGSLNWSAYGRLFDTVQFATTPQGFSCTIALSASVDSAMRVVSFNQDTVAYSVQLQ